MKYTPVTAVWEITMGCNMRCDHCGSSCAEPLPDELTTDEALNVCDQMRAVGLKWITLSGGEPLTRKDWPLLAGRLYQNGIIPNIITNGWLVTEEMIKVAEANGVETIAISLDGPKDIHDTIRKEGAYDKVIKAFDLLNKMNHVSGANTTVTKKNIDQLDNIKEILLKHNVDLWQIQIGLPMGNLENHKDLIIDPEEIDYLLDYCYTTAQEGRIKVFPADCLGYYTTKEAIVRQMSVGGGSPVIWQGCNAGKRSFGLLHNGNVLGCTSIRKSSFVEGNIKDRSLSEIWNDPASFKWARTLKKSDLYGECKRCCYGDVCLGGCPNTRLTLNGTIYSENHYCSYNLALHRTKMKIAEYNDLTTLMDVAWRYVREEKWQLAALTLDHAQTIAPDEVIILELAGFVDFNLRNFEASRRSNEKILRKNPNNAYALKGIGLCFHKLGYPQEAIKHLTKATELSDTTTIDAYYDLSIVYSEIGKIPEAIRTLERAEQKVPGFISSVYQFYNQLHQAAAMGR